MAIVNLKLNPLIQYSTLWLYIGLTIIAGIGCYYGLVLWFLRTQRIKLLANSKPAKPAVDLATLKQKYLTLIDECYQSYQRGETDLRGIHQGLSMTVRYFVYELYRFPAPRLTLADLQRSPYPTLTNIVSDYYLEEFARVEQGNAATAVAAAKAMIQQWG